MKQRLRYLSAVFFVALLTIPTSQLALAQAVWNGPHKITSIIVDTDDTGKYIHMTLDGIINPFGCTYSHLVRIDGSTQSGKYMYMQALIANATNNSVTLFYNGCDDVGFPKITGLQIIGD
jgi:hypothetical protein